MGIGTSLGAYFENDFSHQAGIEDHTHDPIERTPDQVDQNKQLEKQDQEVLGGTEVRLKGTALSDSLIKEFEAFRKMGKPYRDQRDGAVATPEPPPPDNVTMIHPIGFKDRSQEPIDLNPMNDTENGVIGVGQTGGEGPSVFNTFMATRGRRQQSNIVEHPTEEVPTPAPALTGRPTDHPDFTRLVDEHYNNLVEHSTAQGNEAWQPRGILPGENLRAFAEREVNRADPDLRYRGHAPEPEFHPDPYQQVPLHYDEATGNWHDAPPGRAIEHVPIDTGTRFSHPMSPEVAFQYHNELHSSGREAEASSFNGDYAGRASDMQYRDYLNGRRLPPADPERYAQEVSVYHGDLAEKKSAKVAEYKSLDEPEVKKGTIGLKLENNGYSMKTFNFYHEPTDTIGSLSISERKEGKQLYVHGMALNDGITPNSLGKRAMRDMIEALKEQYPNAETIAGFRVSGARAATGSGAADAQMRIRPAKD